MANQPVRVPNDLPYGDRQKLEAAQRMAPLPKAGAAGGTPPPAAQAASAGGAKLPSYLFSRPSDRPAEQPTEGLSIGPGAGPEALQTQQQPDLLQSYLERLAYGYNSRVALETLLEMSTGGGGDEQPTDVASSLGQPQGDLAVLGDTDNGDTGGGGQELELFPGEDEGTPPPAGEAPPEEVPPPIDEGGGDAGTDDTATE